VKRFSGDDIALLDSFWTARLVCTKDLRPSTSLLGAVAQLGERMTGSHEVRGSIPLGSTNRPLYLVRFK
jgi:hypothetical protein